ncbi:unnamed protein product [Discula destructiva]
MWATNPKAPVDCGRRLLPVVIDQRAQDEPESPWCSLPVDDYDLSKGFEDISISTFANAINRLAWFIKSAIGTSSTFETVAYLGVTDIRYHMMQMAVCKTGHKVLFSSLLNNKGVHVSLLEQTDCQFLLSGVGVHVDDILAARPMEHVVIPDLEDLLDSEKVPHFPYDKTFDEAQNHPYIVLHTSGTTGAPKTIVWNHALMATQDRQLLLDDACGRESYSTLTHPGEGVRYLITTSPAHSISSGLLMCISVFNKAVAVPGFRHRGVSPSDLLELLPQAKCTNGILTPWMMEDVARRPDAGKFIQEFDNVSYSGAVLSAFAAEVWGKYTKIQNVWGATECLGAPLLTADNEDYNYVYFNTVAGGHEFRPVDSTSSIDGETQDIYELVLKLTEASAPLASWYLRQDSGLSSTPKEWPTGDIWTPHPDPDKAAYAWKFVCRKDDLFSFSTGVSGNPASLERDIMEAGAAKIRAALVTGSMHQQSVALIELAEGQEASPELAAELWEQHIEPANEKAQAHLRVAKTHVLLVPPGAVPRTGKGSIIRKSTETKFKQEIEALYEKFGDEWQDAKVRYGSISQTTSITVEVATNGQH